MRYFSVTLVILFFLTTSIAQTPSLNSAEEYSQRGMSRFEKNDLDGAIADFTKVIEMNGRAQEFCYYFRGLAWYRKGNLDQAIADLTRAIAIKANPRFYDDRGNLLAKKGDLDGAVADLNKAIELAPQYAKAYGDRGIVRLMRGEYVEAELDFKKCFELDKTLETQMKPAANQIRQRAILKYEYEKPVDVEVTKFSWDENPSTVLIAAPGSISVPYSNVSQTGTRVLSSPDKGEPGPGVPVDPSLSQPGSRPPSGNTKTVIAKNFSVTIKNTGSKTISAIQWGYFFYPKDPAHEPLAYVFNTKSNLAPGKQKTLSDSAPAMGASVNPKLPTKNNRTLFNERIVILRLDYADGSSWQSSRSLPAVPPTK